MRLGYNTNGLAHHRLVDAIDLLADEDFQSVAITLDVGALDPYQDPLFLAREVRIVRAALERRGLACVVETGARYLLNPHAKHDPTLMDQDFLCRAIDLAEALQAESVSLWSGRSAIPTDEEESGLDRLCDALKPVLDRAEKVRVPLAFEPEPGMFIDTLERFGRLDERIRHPLFQLTVDLGHVHCLAEGDWDSLLTRWRTRIINIHIEDRVQNGHEHLMFGEGTMDFPTIFRVLHEIDYGYGLHVELSRHSHMAVEAVHRAATFLKPFVDESR
jgi:sugar phosphate isomerase/epimerase